MKPRLLLVLEFPLLWDLSCSAREGAIRGGAEATHQFLAEGFTDAERGSHLERKRKVNISQSKDVCADNFDSAQRRWHFVSGGGSYVSNSAAAAHSLFSTPRSSPPSPLPICLPLCLAHPTPAFSVSLLSCELFPFSSKVNPLLEQRITVSKPTLHAFSHLFSGSS